MEASNGCGQGVIIVIEKTLKNRDVPSHTGCTRESQNLNDNILRITRDLSQAFCLYAWLSNF